MAKRKVGDSDHFESLDEANAFINQVFNNMVPDSVAVKKNENRPLIYVFNIKVDAKANLKAKHRQASREARGKERELLVELIEQPASMTLVAEMPGIDATKILLVSDARRLAIKSNISGKMFEKFMDLPCRTDPRKAKALYNNGVLEVTLTKSESYSGREMKIRVM